MSEQDLEEQGQEAQCLDRENQREQAISELQSELEALRKENERLKGEKPLPDAWWKDCPGVAQKVMERIIDRNDTLEAENEKLKEALENANKRFLAITSSNEPSHNVPGDILNYAKYGHEEAEQALKGTP